MELDIVVDEAYRSAKCGHWRIKEYWRTMMLCFHRTRFAGDILSDGFRNGRGTYGTEVEFEGVFFSDRPLDTNEGANGHVVLELEIPDEVLARFEWPQGDERYREFCIPEAVVNQYAPPHIHEADFAGESIDWVQGIIARFEDAKQLEAAQELKRHLEFLKAHGLLGNE